MSWEWWQRAVRDGKPGPVNESDPQEGFYRVKLSGKFVPLAIWYPRNSETDEIDGDLICMVGFNSDKRQVDPFEILSDLYCANWWVIAAKNSITEARYRHAMATGHWDDVDPIVETMDQIASGVQAADEERRAIGGNKPPETDALKDQIEAANAGVKTYEKIATDDAAAKAQTLRAHLNELSGKADKRRKDLKQPHLDAGNAVDAEWMPIVKAAKAGANAIAKALSSFFTTKEEERKAQEAQSRAEQPRGVNVPTPQPVPAPTQVKGGSGRGATIKVVNIITEVTDWEVLFAYLKGNREVDAVLLKVAQNFVDAGHKVPGVTVEERRKVA